MAIFGNVTEDVKGAMNFLDQVTFQQGVGGAPTPGQVYFVDRSKQSDVSGDGKSWKNAFLTIGEAISAVNSDYTNGTSPSEGRNRWILIAEGWYGEVPLTLTASDVHLVSVAPGHHDPTVLYGSATAGGFDIGAGGPALSVTGSNNTIWNLKGFTHDVLYPAFKNGALAVTSTGNRWINCGVVRDVDNGCLGGLLDYGADGTLIENFFGSTSCKDYTVQVETNGVINPVNCHIKGGMSVGVPTPIDANAGHNTVVDGHTMMDDTSDRPGTVTVPVAAAGSTNLIVKNCYSEFSNANVVTGGTSTLAINNFHLATPA